MKSLSCLSLFFIIGLARGGYITFGHKLSYVYYVQEEGQLEVPGNLVQFLEKLIAETVDLELKTIHRYPVNFAHSVRDEPFYALQQTMSINPDIFKLKNKDTYMLMIPIAVKSVEDVFIDSSDAKERQLQFHVSGRMIYWEIPVLSPIFFEKYKLEDFAMQLTTREELDTYLHPLFEKSHAFAQRKFTKNANANNKKRVEIQAVLSKLLPEWFEKYALPVKYTFSDDDSLLFRYSDDLCNYKVINRSVMSDQMLLMNYIFPKGEEKEWAAAESALKIRREFMLSNEVKLYTSDRQTITITYEVPIHRNYASYRQYLPHVVHRLAPDIITNFDNNAIYVATRERRNIYFNVLRYAMFNPDNKTNTIPIGNQFDVLIYDSHAYLTEAGNTTPYAGHQFINKYTGLFVPNYAYVTASRSTDAYALRSYIYMGLGVVCSDKSTFENASNHKKFIMVWTVIKKLAGHGLVWENADPHTIYGCTRLLSSNKADSTDYFIGDPKQNIRESGAKHAHLSKTIVKYRIFSDNFTIKTPKFITERPTTFGKCFYDFLMTPSTGFKDCDTEDNILNIISKAFKLITEALNTYLIFQNYLYTMNSLYENFLTLFASLNYLMSNELKSFVAHFKKTIEMASNHWDMPKNKAFVVYHIMMLASSDPIDSPFTYLSNPDFFKNFDLNNNMNKVFCNYFYKRNVNDFIYPETFNIDLRPHESTIFPLETQATVTNYLNKSIYGSAAVLRIKRDKTKGTMLSMKTIYIPGKMACKKKVADIYDFAVNDMKTFSFSDDYRAPPNIKYRHSLSLVKTGYITKDGERVKKVIEVDQNPIDY